MSYGASGLETFMYNDKVYDAFTGLYYYNSRYYDPAVGRFVTEDTYTNSMPTSMDLNLNSYAGDNPITNTDPTGHGKFVDAWHGSYHLEGWRYALYPGISLGIGYITFLVGIATMYVFASAGLGAAVIAAVLLGAQGYASYPTGIAYLYFEIVYNTWWIFSWPVYAEAGWYTNQITVPFTTHSTQLGSYAYFPTFNTAYRNPTTAFHSGTWPNGY